MPHTMKCEECDCIVNEEHDRKYGYYYCDPCYEDALKSKFTIYSYCGGDEWMSELPTRIILNGEEYNAVQKREKPRHLLEDCREDELAGITSRQLTKLIDLLPEHLLPLVKKIMDETDEDDDT